MGEKDYYKILGVTPSAKEEEIKKAFFRLAKKYHPDRHRGEDSGVYERKFAGINEAYNVLKDQAAKAEYDRRLKERGNQKRRKTTQDHYQAEELFDTAQKAIQLKDYNSAINLLKAAVRLEPEKSEYYSALGIALSMKPRRLHEAREMCEKAVEMEPYDVRNYLNLGLVYKKAGLKIRAQKQFEKVLRWDPKNPVARRELGLSEETALFGLVKNFVRRLKRK